MDEQERRPLSSLLKAVSFALLVAAVVRELRTPADERTWHGRIGFVPYDLRPPTLARVRAAWWNPDDDRLVTPRAFGVGWSVNLGRVWKLIADARAARAA